MLKVSVICEADSLDIQEFIKDQQTFISVSMKSCIICYGWKLTIKIMILSFSEEPIIADKLLNRLKRQCCYFPLLY